MDLCKMAPKDVLDRHLKTLQERQAELQRDIEKYETVLASRRQSLDAVNAAIHEFAQHPWMAVNDDQSHVLDQEYETYMREKDRLLAESAGKHVLIKGDQVIGVYETHMEAIRDGYHALGNVPFLVKAIVEVEPVYQLVPRLVRVQ
jgi:hypothetical protein